MAPTPNFPAPDCRKADWRPLIMAAMTWLSDVGDGDVRFNDIIDHIGGLDGFPGWHVWGDYNGKPNQMGRRYVSLEATALKKAGVLTSPRRGTYRLASEVAAEAPAVEPTVAHKTVLAVVPDPEPEITAPEPVEAPVADGPTTHPLYLSSERARKAAIAQTRCFGFFSERAATCGGCPLAGLCLTARGANVAEANARVEAARAEAARIEAERVEAERVEAERLRVEAEEAARMESLAATVVNALGDSTEEAQSEASPVLTGKVVQIPWSIICSGCGERTEPNEEVVSIEDHGAFHQGCTPQNTALFPSD